MAELADILKRLIDNKLTISTAESCTGGMIASAIVDYPGASNCFNEGYVTYSNLAKMKNLGVKEETLATFGAVSEETSKEMAMGVRLRALSDFGLSSTGIAGPQGGTPEKPVGLVYICCAYGDSKTKVRELHLSGDRAAIRKHTVSFAIDLLDECMKELCI